MRQGGADHIEVEEHVTGMTATPVTEADHLLEGIEAFDVPTARLTVRVLERAGTDRSGTPLLLVHGNCSSSLFFQRLMLALPGSIRPIAVDLRGYGETEARPIDATRGLADHADDVLAALDALGLEKAHLFGWSMGAGVVLTVLLSAPQRVAGLTLQSPVSPFGYGGTAGAEGRRYFADGACSGAGGANPRFVELISGNDPDGNRQDGGAPEAASPRATMRALYVAPREVPWPDEDMWIASMLTTRTGEGFYPGDVVASDNWPGNAPGTRGVLNSMAPQYCRLDGIVDVDSKPPVLWLRGEKDLIVSDQAFLDVATLGSMGVVPDWPGADRVPPQPMVTQTRTVLQRYAEAGGDYREIVYPGVGHSPHLEVEPQVVAALTEHVRT